MRENFANISKSALRKNLKPGSIVGLEGTYPTGPPPSPRAPGSGSYGRSKAQLFRLVSREPLAQSSPNHQPIVGLHGAFRMSPPTS